MRLALAPKIDGKAQPISGSRVQRIPCSRDAPTKPLVVTGFPPSLVESVRLLWRSIRRPAKLERQHTIPCPRDLAQSRQPCRASNPAAIRCGKSASIKQLAVTGFLPISVACVRSALRSIPNPEVWFPQTQVMGRTAAKLGRGKTQQTRDKNRLVMDSFGVAPMKRLAVIALALRREASASLLCRLTRQRGRFDRYRGAPDAKSLQPLYDAGSPR